MAFLDNSGDIILDAVLTDTGRMRLAKGDGSFRITKFALGDDEIDYSLYDKNNANGSAYYDLQILQTPIFEAFTNNIASLNSRLISISRNNLLFLPVILVNPGVNQNYAIPQLVQNGYILAVDSDTEKYLANTSLTYGGASVGGKGILTGFTIGSGIIVRVDQGINSTQVPASTTIDPDLKETQYLIEIDNRFAALTDGTNVATPSYVDDDQVAAYYVSLGTDSTYVSENKSISTNTDEVVLGSRGTTFKFKLKAQLEVSTSDYLFNQLGTSLTSGFSGVSATNVRGILTSVRITGLTTGSSLEVPLLLVKKIS